MIILDPCHSPCRHCIGGVTDLRCRAPVMKWGVVLAGAADFLRPAEKLSLPQNAALLATGSLWTRWCFVIRPQNMLYVFLLDTGVERRTPWGCLCGLADP